MNRALVDAVVNAVLYEGYILYPYRPSVKNRQRWTFGGLYPESWSMAHEGDASAMRTECLVMGGPQTTLNVTVRFLHLTARRIGVPVDGGGFRMVESLQVGDRLWHSWQEAVERSISLDDVTLAALCAAV